jgi:hypothetical protein
MLAGCSSNPIVSDELETKGISQQDDKGYHCSTPDYYENVLIDKQVSFIWDEELSAYTVEIPELCVKFIATPRNKELDVLTRKESQYLEEKEISIKNNTLFAGGYKYRFFDKEAIETLDDALQKRFRIRFEDNDRRVYHNQGYCIIAKHPDISHLYARPQIDGVADKDSHYTLIRPTDIDEEGAIGEFRYYDSHHCGTLYPIQGVGFDMTKPYGILYTNTHPTRYFFYPEYI